MVDRRQLRDFAIAFVLAVPTIAMSRPQPTPAELNGNRSQVVERAADAEMTTAQRRADIEADA